VGELPHSLCPHQPETDHEYEVLGGKVATERSGSVRRFVCTVKFQGATDFAMQRFAAIPGSRFFRY
jgi:hypothetical protein